MAAFPFVNPGAYYIVFCLMPLLSAAKDDEISYSVSIKTDTVIFIVIGCIVALLLLTCCCFCMRKHRKRKHRRELQAAVAAAVGDTPKTDDLQSIDMPYEQQRQLNTGSTYNSSTAQPHRSGTPVSTDAGVFYSSTVQSYGSADMHSSSLWNDPVIVAARIPVDRVELGELLSQGGFGEVYRGRYRDQNVAVKTLPPSTRKDMHHIEAFLVEIKLTATMEHPQIVQFIGVAWESLSELYAVSEFMEGGDLRAMLQMYDEDDRPHGFDPTKIKVALQVAHALTYLHSLDPVVLHRDLKSRNILLTEALDAKITDFGASRIRSDHTMTAGVGTSFWMAPEVVMGEQYGEKADVYSFGIVLSELDTHELPYSQAKENSDTGRRLPDAAVLQLVLMGRLQVQFSGVGPIEMTELAQQCLLIEPQDRPTAAEVLYRLHTVSREHPNSYAF